jgi:hypothetical protein
MSYVKNGSILHSLPQELPHEILAVDMLFLLYLRAAPADPVFTGLGVGF